MGESTFMGWVYTTRENDFQCQFWEFTPIAQRAFTGFTREAADYEDWSEGVFRGQGDVKGAGQRGGFWFAHN